jgi:hypothetical protein
MKSRRFAATRGANQRLHMTTSKLLTAPVGDGVIDATIRIWLSVAQACPMVQSHAASQAV